jgi:hypothetical protein
MATPPPQQHGAMVKPQVLLWDWEFIAWWEIMKYNFHRDEHCARLADALVKGVYWDCLTDRLPDQCECDIAQVFNGSL